MKRLQKKRSQKTGHAGALQDGDSAKARRQKLSELRTLKKLASPEFLKELQEKEDFYYFNLSLSKSGSGQRFSEETIRDPIFRAIR